MTTVLFLKSHKLDAQHVSYNSAPTAYGDLLGGRVQFYCATVSSATPFVNDNRLRAIAVSSLARSSVLPDVPTMHESGMPKFEPGAWNGMLVPAKTSAAAINTLNAAILRALKDQGVIAQLERQGTMALGKSSAEYGRYLRSEHERWGKIIREVGMK